MDGAGRIYVTDADNHRIVRVSGMPGADRATFATLGSGTGRFDVPYGIFVR